MSTHTRPRTHVLSIHYVRLFARLRERELQFLLDHHTDDGPVRLNGIELPGWVRGVRVEKAGRFSWALVLTSERGH
jgi:hypothetical protein